MINESFSLCEASVVPFTAMAKYKEFPVSLIILCHPRQDFLLFLPAHSECVRINSDSADSYQILVKCLFCSHIHKNGI